MRIVMNISESVSSDESELESLELVEDLKSQVAAFVPAIELLTRQVNAIQQRAAAKQNPLTDELVIKVPAVAEWAGAPAMRPTDLLRLILEKGTLKTDLQTRRIWLQPAVAERLGLLPVLTLFELLRELFRWFGI